MDIRKVGSLQDLAQMLQGGRDEEWDAVMKELTEFTNNGLDTIAGSDKLAQEYVHQQFHKIMNNFPKSFNTRLEVAPQILRLIAEAIELKQKRAKELDEKRKNRREGDRKDMH